jgi:hypothetical protein
MSALGHKQALRLVRLMSTLPPIADILAPPKKKGTGTTTGPFPHSLALLSAFGNNRRRRGLALADTVGLRRGRDGQESHRRCRQ